VKNSAERVRGTKPESAAVLEQLHRPAAGIFTRTSPMYVSASDSEVTFQWFDRAVEGRTIT
jgi:hypothetical protein